MSVLLQGAGRGREGEPGALFSSCWLFPELYPHLISTEQQQKNSNHLDEAFVLRISRIF